MSGYNTEFEIGGLSIGIQQKAYFIADIAANHDGDLMRAKDLIWRAKEAGADCAKFQHFKADKIVSARGFDNMIDQLSHQADWKKSVHEVYDQYHTRRDWTDQLVKTCEDADIEFMTTPYDTEAIDEFAKHISAFKIGSGDITFHSAIKRAASYDKPVLLATGASDMTEVEAAVNASLSVNSKLCLMQCNTNYTGSYENFHHVNLNVLKSFASKWPGLPLGFSDHTPGHSAVLGAIVLGARVVEKHFTDDNSREGPDHKFALNPVTWSQMISATREVEAALGDGVKRVEANETDTVVIQRRAIYAKAGMAAGTIISEGDLEFLRPCQPGDCQPFEVTELLGKKLVNNISAGTAIRWENVNAS